MTGLILDVREWISSSTDDAEMSTLGSVKIDADGVVATRVYDKLAQTVREHIHVPAYFIAHWLVTNWWRLRWEPRREECTPDWLHSHSMASIGGGYAWPNLEFVSDGEFIQLHQEAEIASDVSGIQYLTTLHDVCVSTPDFERAIDHFISAVQSRLHSLPSLAVFRGELDELISELTEERTDPALAKTCKLQALAGIDPGAADEIWLKGSRELENVAGLSATEEILANKVEPAVAKSTVEAMRASSVKIDLTWAPVQAATHIPSEHPWERASHAARAVRREIGLKDGPLSNEKLEELFGTRVFSAKTNAPKSPGFLGAYRDDGVHVLWPNKRDDSRRFYLARIIAAHCAVPRLEQVLAVTGARTSLQKMERAFAQEFLCPWADLDTYTDEHGTEDDVLLDFAEDYVVSDWLVRATLVDKGKIPRARLRPSW